MSKRCVWSLFYGYRRHHIEDSLTNAYIITVILNDNDHLICFILSVQVLYTALKCSIKILYWYFSVILPNHHALEKYKKNEVIFENKYELN